MQSRSDHPQEEKNKIRKDWYYFGSIKFDQVFFELMPCALEALTVIKTFCLWLAIPTCWRIGESKKLGVFKTTQTQNTTNQNPTKTEPKQPKKTLRTLRETLRFQKKSPSRSVLLRDVIANLTHRCPKWLKVLRCQKVVVLYPPSHWTRVRSWFTHVHVDKTAQGSRAIEIVIAIMQIPETKGKVVILLQWSRWLNGDPGGSSFHATVVKVDPGEDKRDNQFWCSSLSCSIR